MEAGSRPIRLQTGVCGIVYAHLYRKRQPTLVKETAPDVSRLQYMDGIDLTNTIYCRQLKNLKKFKKFVI